jgi:hypothetical protein
MQHETINDALIECVKAAGGSKTVGAILWPEKTINDAQRLLLACLNTERSEKLCPMQMMLVLKLAKQAGCHDGVAFITTSLGYSVPTPIKTEDETAQLMREFILAQKAMTAIAEKLNASGGL